jgi:membrane protease YdiL (CAAX protease family)
MTDQPIDGAKPTINSDSRLIAVAWLVTVALAIVPDLTATRTPSSVPWAVLAALLSPALIPFLWPRARPLRTYAGMLVLMMVLAVIVWNGLPMWMSHQEWFPDLSGYAAAVITQAPKLVAAFVMMGVLALRGFRRQEFFVSGSPMKLWAGFGVVVAVIMGVTMFTYLGPTARQPGGATEGVRYVPLALLLAAMNAFAEEMLYRGTLLAPLLRQVTRNQAITMTAVLFGVAHYYGTPSGVPGMVVTFIAGWVFGLAMVETRSILLPWFLHFVPDAVIYVTSVLPK